MLGFSHIDLTVTDVERAAQWWQDVMGLQAPARRTYEKAGMKHVPMARYFKML